MKCFLIVLLICVGQICGSHEGPRDNRTEHPLSPNHHHGTGRPITKDSHDNKHHNGSEHHGSHHHNGTHHGWFEHAVRVRYCTWSPVNNKTVSNCIKLVAPVNSTFYDVMMMAQQKDTQHFGFQATLYPNMGHYITSIGGLEQNQAAAMYWMLYVLPQKPNMKHPPTSQQLSPVGVDQLVVQPKTNYLFWYQHQ